MRFAKLRDVLVIAVLAAAGLLFAFSSGLFAKSGAKAEIYYHYELVKSVDLTPGAEKSFSIEQLPNVVFHTYPDGSIAFVQSDCPDKVCIHTGRIHLPGQTAACLPNMVYVKIADQGKKDPDTPDFIIG